MMRVSSSLFVGALIGLLSAGVSAEPITTTISYSSCDAGCNTPTFVNQTIHDTSLLSFSNAFGSISARSDFGVYKAGVVSTFVSDGSGGFLSQSSGTANSSAIDVITFGGGAGTGTGTIRLHIDGSFGVEGDTSSSTSAGMSFRFLLGAANVIASISMDTTNGTSNLVGTYDSSTGTLTAPFQFEYGLNYQDTGGFLEAFGAFGGFSLFANTVTLEFILPEGTTILSEEDATYRIASATGIPEPQTALILGLGCLALLARGRLRFIG